MRVGLDVDGVLADFNTQFVRTIIEVTGEDKFPPTNRYPVWDYPEHFSYTPMQMSDVWTKIKNSTSFWRTLAPEASVDFSVIERVSGWPHDVYFITSRPGVCAKLQTEAWLVDRGITNPTVLITSHKGSACATLGIDAYIDDKTDNIQSVEHLSPGTRAYLLNCSYNATGQVQRRVESVSEFLKKEL